LSEVPRPGRLAVWAVALVALGLAGGFFLWALKRPAPLTVTVFGPGGPVTVSTRARTVGELLRENGYPMGDRDVVVPSADTLLTEGLEVDLGLVERKIETVRKKVARQVKTVYTETLGVGEILDVDPGEDGFGEFTTESFTLNGVTAFEKVLETKWIRRPKPAVVYEGTSTRSKLYRMPKRYRVKKALKLEATAYYAGPGDTGRYADGLNSTNQKAGYGVAAVDPRVIRMKTPLYIEGYGFAWAADVGGAIKGRHIDLCYDTYEEAVRFGRKDVQVFILR
jgi:3D (Asp-Asp-Asp) domain-containing protein